MKSSILLSIFLSISFGLFSQNIDLSFHPQDGNAIIDSVLITNLNNGQKAKLSGNETLVLVKTTTGIIPIQKVQKTGYLYPNPCNGDANVFFSTIKNEVVELNLYNILGQLLTREVKSLDHGTHNFLLKFPIAGIYYVSVLKSDNVQSYKVVYSGITNQPSHIIYVGSEKIAYNSEIIQFKSAKTDITLNYSEGDIIQYTVYSGMKATILSDSPKETKIYEVPFYECKDADNNNYKVVQIGSQIWMAENLKTTKVRNGASIPNVLQDTKWKTLTTGAYCHYNNDASYANTYGCLYNWYAVNDSRSIAPIDWHIPSDDEWKQLEIALGMTQEQADYSEDAAGHLRGTDQGAQLKALHGWDNNGNGTNKSNFTALPGGSRSESGSFSVIGKSGNWWSSSEDNNYIDFAWFRRLVTRSIVIRSILNKVLGLSVRCVYDYEASSSNLPPNVNFKTSSIYFTKGQSIQFKDISINSPTSWLWDFGDNTTSTSQNPSHTYNVTGNYTISLTAYNDFGNTTKTMNIPVAETVETVTDIDKNVYHTVVIGSQTWMVENLKTTRYRNGDRIPNPTQNSSWESSTTGAYCYYKNDADYAKTYGCLYNWYAVNDSRNIAPAGWHIPSDAEWKQLGMALGMTQSQVNEYGYFSNTQGTKMKATFNWNDCNGTNSSGFTALPGGYRLPLGFSYIGEYGFWWSSTGNNTDSAWNIRIGCFSPDVNNYYSEKWNGYSVRCIKD